MTGRTLTADQRRATALLGQGRMVKEVAEEVGVAAKTITRRSQQPEVRALVRSHRENLMPETATAEAVLTAALVATKPNGEPDWANRIAAAKAILSTPIASPEAQVQARETRIPAALRGWCNALESDLQTHGSTALASQNLTDVYGYPLGVFVLGELETRCHL